MCPRNTVCFRYRTVNSLHKGHNKDSNNNNNKTNLNEVYTQLYL